MKCDVAWGKRHAAIARCNDEIHEDNMRFHALNALTVTFPFAGFPRGPAADIMCCGDESKTMLRSFAGFSCLRLYSSRASRYLTFSARRHGHFTRSESARRTVLTHQKRQEKPKKQEDDGLCGRCGRIPAKLPHPIFCSNIC